jgi:quercetin dioxygenase-like cupin family protein
MSDAAQSTDPMEGHVARFGDIKKNAVPIQFIDSVLEGHYRNNFSILGSTASQNPDYRPVLTVPQKFQIGMYEAPPGNGPGWHTHTYVELFMPLTGKWKYSYGTNKEDPEDILGEIILEPWDVITFPPLLWRRFENVSDTNALGFAVLDPIEPFSIEDPIWPEFMVKRAAEAGLHTDENGRMIIPDGLAEMEARVSAIISATRGADSPI